jgi:sortase A
MNRSLLLLIIAPVLSVGTYLALQKPAPPAAGAVAGISVTQENSTTPAHGVPKTLHIPKLGISVPVESVGKDAKGLMDVPKVVTNTAWYNRGPRPGELGNAVIDGHLDTPQGKPSVFYSLHTLTPGDLLYVEDEFGKRATFRVTRLATYETDSFPVQEVFGNADTARLNLITCGGKWDRSKKNYTQRTVVFSQKSETP